MNTQRITLPINDLSTRGDGVLIVQQALEKAPGVVHVYINPSIEMAYIEFDPALVDPVRLAKVVEDAGFRAGVPSLR